MNRKTSLLTVALIIYCLYVTSVCFATSFTYTYDVATPVGTDAPSVLDNRIREVKAALQERLNVEHIFDLTGTEVSHADTGKHTDITCYSLTSAGAISGTTISGSGNLAINTDKFTVAAATGNTAIAGTLDVTGAAEVTGAATLGDASLLKTSAAPTTDAMIANKKYVDDQDTAITDPTYSGGESHTFIGGLIIKMGYKVRDDLYTTVTFGTPFPNACVSVNINSLYNGGISNEPHLRYAPTTEHFIIVQANLATGFYWTAIGR